MMDATRLAADFGLCGPGLKELWDTASPAFAPFASQLRDLPDAAPSVRRLDQDRVAAGIREDLSSDQHERLLGLCKAFKPWRKGPFSLFGIDIDSEWDSALKWRRVVPHITPLAGRRVLDVGSSNGYYLFRMAAEHPEVVLGVEPYLRYFAQYLLLQRYIAAPRLHSLPVGLEQLDRISGWFDTVFCMGILYHRRAPLDTLAQLKELLAPGGELVLETLILEGDEDLCLCPKNRYAAMRNVFFIPTVACLAGWLERCGFSTIRCVDTTATTTAEQRKTDWIDSASLDRFLDPNDASRTIEGYPAPVRAVVIASK